MYSQQLNFSNLTPDRLILLCGEFNKNLKQIEKALRIKVLQNGTEFELKGKKEDVGIGVSALFSLKEKLETNMKMRLEMMRFISYCYKSKTEVLLV